MHEKLLVDFLESIDSKININDFNTIESNMKFSLRFELGDDLKNGTKKRVNQATKRAIQLFEECFSEDQELYLLSFDFPEELFARTPEYLYKVINQKGIISERKLATRHFDNEEPEYEIGKLFITKTQFVELDYKNILRGIANAEMGFDPCVHQVVYFFGK